MKDFAAGLKGGAIFGGVLDAGFDESFDGSFDRSPAIVFPGVFCVVSIDNFSLNESSLGSRLS